MKPIDLGLFHRVHDNLVANGTRYGWGSKALPSTETSQIHKIDCSGYVAYQMGRQGITIPEGSVAERDWFLANGTKKRFLDILLPPVSEDDARLFVAGYNKGGTHRHIFFVIAGQTYESGSSINGVGSRPAANFLHRVEWCVEIPVVK